MLGNYPYRAAAVVVRNPHKEGRLFAWATQGNVSASMVRSRLLTRQTAELHQSAPDTYVLRVRGTVPATVLVALNLDAALQQAECELLRANIHPLAMK
jgi:hypothetical protein